MIDDVLFSGREPLTDYDQRLWDAEIIFSWGMSKYGYPPVELIYTRYFDDYDLPDWSLKNGFEMIEYARRGNGKMPLSADCAIGGADRNVYASYVGFPSTGGAGSSFTPQQSMGISASFALCRLFHQP